MRTIVIGFGIYNRMSSQHCKTLWQHKEQSNCNNHSPDSLFHSLSGLVFCGLWCQVSEAVRSEGLWPLCYCYSHTVVPWGIAWISRLGSVIDAKSPTKVFQRWKVGAISWMPSGWDNQGRCYCKTGSSSILHMQNARRPKEQDGSVLSMPRLVSPEMP